MAKSDSERLDRIFFALSDPSRRAIIRQLAKGESTVGQLSTPQPLAPATLSRHLRVLERAGLIEQVRDGRFLRTRLKPAPLWSGTAWVDEVRGLWEHQLDSLEQFLQSRRGRQP